LQLRAPSFHRADHHEQHGRQQHAAIELVDLFLGFLLARGERNGEDGLAAFESELRAAAEAAGVALEVRRPKLLESFSVGS